MILETEKKLNRRPTTIPVITILSFTLLLASMTFFTNLPQSSFAQTTQMQIRHPQHNDHYHHFVKNLQRRQDKVQNM